MSIKLLEKVPFTGQLRMPPILQGEAAECGIACVAMISTYFGRRVDLQVLRRNYAASMRGATLHDLMRVASRLGLVGRALQVDDVKDLRQLRLPAILHWDLKHFVVLRGFRRGRSLIVDPAVGARSMPLEEVSKHFTGVALELRPAPTFSKREERQDLKVGDLLSHAVGLFGYLAQISAVAIVAQIFVVLTPLYVQLVVDEGLVRADATFLSVLAIGFLTLVGVQAVLGWIRSIALNYLGHVLSLQLQTNLIGHLLRLPVGYFLKRHIGDITSRVSSASSFQSVITNGLVTGIVDAIGVIFALVALLIYSPQLFSIPLIVLVLYILLRFFRLSSLRETTAENVQALANSSAHLIETVQSIATVKLFGLENSRLSHWQNRYIQATNSAVRVARMNIGFSVATQALLAVGQIAVIYFGALLVLNQSFTVGMLMAFIAFQMQFLMSGINLVDLWNSYRLLGVHLHRISDIALTSPEEDPHETSYIESEVTPSLEVRNVSYRYGAWDRCVLSDINLTVSPGECVAIVGPSGVGKSTLIRIMLSLVRPDSGVVALGGIDIRSFGLMNYRKMVASVTQEDRLFSGSLAENITMFTDQPDENLMIECAQRCYIHDAILAMPMKYHSLVGEMGGVLSAGERQRVMLARALYRQPKILFLDEATSNLDLNLDQKINEMLASLSITRIVATHRNTVRLYADKVYELRCGTLESKRR